MKKVFAHKNPDTDAICAPLAYAWYLNNIKNEEAQAYSTGEFNKETKFVLNYFKVEEPEVIESLTKGDDYVLIDTNNPEELIEKYEEANLVEIIDHHKLVGGLSTESPIDVTMKQSGSSSTLVYEKIKASSEDIPEWVAGVLISGILSDTLKFTSPTTTEIDKIYAQELAKIANINIDEYTNKLFEAKSDLSGMDPRDILLGDSKIFEMGDKKVRVTVLETTNPEVAKNMSADFIKTMVGIKNEEELDHMFFYIVDILNTSSEMIVSTQEEKDIAEKAYNSKFNGDFMHLDGVVSRKKQMVPNLENIIS